MLYTNHHYPKLCMIPSLVPNSSLTMMAMMVGNIILSKVCNMDKKKCCIGLLIVHYRALPKTVRNMKYKYKIQIQNAYILQIQSRNRKYKNASYKIQKEMVHWPTIAGLGKSCCGPKYCSHSLARGN